MTTYSTMALSRRFEHRYKFDAKVYNLRTKKFVGTTIFLDTGCFNTMIPRYLAELSGHPLGFKMKYSLGANVVESEAFSIDKIMIGDFVLERVVAFAGKYKGRQEPQPRREAAKVPLLPPIRPACTVGGKVAVIKPFR